MMDKKIRLVDPSRPSPRPYAGCVRLSGRVRKQLQIFPAALYFCLNSIGYGRLEIELGGPISLTSDFDFSASHGHSES